jgi:hypothetical protein
MTFLQRKGRQMIRTTPTTTAATKAVAVTGADIDPSLAAKLTIGDKVLVEINGTRVYSGYKCPLVAEEPWQVRVNDAPQSGERPNESNVLILSHPSIDHDLILHYSNLLHLSPRQPAVFQEQDVTLSSQNGQANVIYVLLQLVSHYVHADLVNSTFEPFDRNQVRGALSEVKDVLLDEWSRSLGRFKITGWGQKSMKRFAMRAFVSPSIVSAFMERDLRVLNTLDTRTLLRVAEAFHWLRYYIEQSPMMVDRDVLSEGTV